MIDLLAVRFNHNPDSARDDALSIRENAKTGISVPEWVKGMTKPEDSRAAYAIREITGHTITIEAKLVCSNPSVNAAYVRAVQPPPPTPPSGWLAWVMKMLEKFPILWHLLAFMFVTGHGKNLLGEVQERNVVFDADGETEFEPFELDKHWLLQRGVGIHQVHWRWQYRLTASGSWVDFADSKHRIYTVLEVPTSPWQQVYQGGSNEQLPWTDVLEHACEWAARTNQVDQAAAQVTRALNRLGPSNLEYSGTGHWFISPKHNFFECSQFLPKLKPQPAGSSPQPVDCSDMATAVTTFANVLGCDLAESQMNSWSSPEQFHTNPIHPIGRPGFTTTLWTYHEVAWKGSGSAGDHLFDGSLLLNGHSNPANAPYSDLEAVNMLFGNPGSGDYRDKLAAANPAGNRAKCSPNMQPRRRAVR